MIYVICFGLSALFAWFASKTKKRTFFVFFSVISILLPVTLAGLRDYSIGIDTSNYMDLEQFWYGAAKRSTLEAYMKYYDSKNLGEPLFALILGLVEHYTGNFTVFLLVAHGIIITGIYIGVFRLRHHANPALMLLLFYLLYFNYSLNALRQYMAMAIIFAVFADIEQGKYLRFAVVVIIARFIHLSALLAFGAILIHWVLYGRFSRVIPSLIPSLRIRRLFVVFVLLFLVFVFPGLCKLLVDKGILPSKYGFYLDPDKTQYNALSVLLLLVEMLVLFVFRKQIKNTSECYNLYLITSISYLLLMQLSGSVAFGKRIAAYYSLANVVTIAIIPKSFKIRTNRIVVTILVVAVAFCYWWYTYILRNGSQTYPYISVFGSM